jgi:hypothetical protein
MPRELLTIEQILDIIRESPPRIAALIEGLEPAKLQTAPDHDEWSASDVLAHLRACADMWGGRILAMIAEDMPTLRAINPRTWINQTDYLDLGFQSSLDEFTCQRRELLAVLEPLPVEGWSREAIMTGAGKPLVKSVHFEADGLARHERAHVKQIGRIVEALRT